MKPNIVKIVVIGTVFMLFLYVNLFAQREVKSTGIGFRIDYWKMSSDPTRIIVSDFGEHTVVNTGSGGVYVSLLSRLNHTTVFELSLGALGEADEETHHYTDSEVNALAIIPILFGVRMELISPESQIALKPYASLGAGPYWFSNINVVDRINDQEVTVDTKVKRGGYLGGGANFLLTDWLAINFDVKYHFINFNVKHEYSGFDYGLGLSVSWGRFR